MIKPLETAKINSKARFQPYFGCFSSAKIAVVGVEPFGDILRLPRFLQ